MQKRRDRERGEIDMQNVPYLWRNLGPPLLWLWPLIVIDKELREFMVANSRLENN